MNKPTILLSLICLLFAPSLFAGSAPPELTASSALLMDYDSGRILYEKNSLDRISPASMTKLMTLMLCYDAISAGELDKDDLIIIDEAGSSFSRPPFSSLMLLEEGQQLSILDLMKGVAIASGNDAAYALAEILGPGKRAFVDKMNGKARSLGMDSTVFVDPDGWSEYNLVTARDYAILAREYIRQYPEALTELHSIPFLVYPLPENMPEGVDFRIQVPRKKTNTNRLLGQVEGVDGLKTGYIDQSGFNFTATALRGKQRVITIIMGVHTDSYYRGILTRAEESARLIEYGYDNFHYQSLPVIESTAVRVWYGDMDSVVPVMTGVDQFVLSDEEYSRLRSERSLPVEIMAPQEAGTILGQVDYYLDDELLTSRDLVLSDSLKKGPWYSRLRDSLILGWRRVKTMF